MKRISSLIAALILMPALLQAQRVVRTSTSPGGDLTTMELAPMTAAGDSGWFDVHNIGATSHMLTFTYTTQPSAVTVKLQCSKDAGATSSDVGTSTSTTGATITGTATCGWINVNISGLTGAVRMRPVYRGYVAADFSGATVNATFDTTGLATSTNLSDSSQKTQVCDSSSHCAPVDATLGLKVQATVDTAGLATSAKQDTAQTSLSAIKTDADTVAGAVSASKMATSVADGSNVTLGAKGDAKSTATDTTAVTMMQVFKEISAMEQAPASRAVTNGGTFPVQATLNAETTKVIGTVNVSSGQTINRSNSTPKMLNALSTSVTTVVGSAGTLTDLYCVNPNTSDAFVQVFDTSGSVTLGATTPVLSFRVIANSSSSGGFGLANMAFTFANAIKVAATTTATGSSAPSTALDCNAGYR